MSRQIVRAIVGVTAIVLLALGVPLAIVAQRSIIDSEVVELQAKVGHLLTEIQLPLDHDALDHLASEPDAPPPFGVYDSSGAKVYGVGPDHADAAVRDALGGTTASTKQSSIVVAAPLTDDAENVVVVVRIGESLSAPHRAARNAWLVMLVAAIVALGLAWMLARRVAGKLSRPVSDLAAAATTVGSGGVLGDRQPSGIAEVDRVADALVESSRRISDALGRERRFSSDVSHQLRTPLAGLRLRLERVTPDDDPVVVADAALGELMRLEQTVAHLLAFARGTAATVSVSDLDDVVREAAQRWTERCAARGHRLVVSARSGAVVRASAVALDQILDVLVDNSLNHGAGDIDLSARRLAGGAAVDVSDSGVVPPSLTDDELFRRGHGSDNGIGLSLARSLAEAEGGRLLLSRRDRTTFSLILLAADDT